MYVCVCTKLYCKHISNVVCIYIYIYIYIYIFLNKKFRKILVENTATITHEINKLRLQILEALHIKTKKKLKSIELILKIATMF